MLFRSGATQFQEQVNFQRGLEGELARTIQSLSAVHGARVHLAMPKASVFVRERQKPPPGGAGTIMRMDLAGKACPGLPEGACAIALADATVAPMEMRMRYAWRVSLPEDIKSYLSTVRTMAIPVQRLLQPETLAAGQMNLPMAMFTSLDLIFIELRSGQRMKQKNASEPLNI
mgnify:CR=1 FL=1